MRLDGPNGSRIVWSFADPAEGGGWSFDQIDMIERLLPHLRQYVRVRQVLGDVDGLNASLATLLDNTTNGVIELDRHGRIVAVNDRARDILKGKDGLFDQGGFLCATHRRTTTISSGCWHGPCRLAAARAPAARW